MSRIGKLPIAIPKGVKVTVEKTRFAVEGPKGKLSQEFPTDIEVKITDNQVNISRKIESQNTRALHGLYRSLFDNMIVGVSEGFQNILTINGVGYRAEVKNNSLMLNLGFSNPIEYPIPENITIEVEANTRMTVRGISKQHVGQVCAEIRSFRPPEPYKGKGVKYDKEIIRRKIGKSGIK